MQNNSWQITWALEFNLFFYRGVENKLGLNNKPMKLKQIKHKISEDNNASTFWMVGRALQQVR